MMVSLGRLLLRLILYMNVSDRQQPQLSTSQHGLLSQIYNICMQSMRSSQAVFPLPQYQHLLTLFEQIGNSKPAVLFLEQFLSALISEASHLKQELSLNLGRQDYAGLEHSLQKSEAEIRKHVKVEQQLKLYLDSLEERIEELQGQLELENQKYLALFDNFKQLDEAHRKLQGQHCQSSQPKKLFASQLTENVASRKTKLGLKSKMLTEKLQQRARRVNQHKKILSITEEEEQVIVPSQQTSIKKSSIDRYGKQPNGHSSIKEMTKSLQMKHERSVESYLRRCKQRTESQKRQGRSSSIMY